MSVLYGMKAICDYINLTEATVLQRIRECGFPAAKMNGGIWESDTELIDEWRINQIRIKSGLAPIKKKSPSKKQK